MFSILLLIDNSLQVKANYKMTFYYSALHLFMNHFTVPGTGSSSKKIWYGFEARFPKPLLYWAGLFESRLTLTQD